MDTHAYTFSVRVEAPIDEAEQRTRNALTEQGFGVLTYIDMAATLKEKVDADIAPYRILGACNPPLAHRAVSADVRIGALLPCNVIVRDLEDGACEVAAADPAAMLQLSDVSELREVAGEAGTRLRAALSSLAG